MRSWKRIFIFLLLLGVCRCDEEATADGGEPEKAGAEYLRSVMNQLQSERAEGHPLDLKELQLATDGSRTTAAAEITTDRIPDPQFQVEVIPASSSSVPDIPPGLTAEELTAIYNAAVAKLASLQMRSSTRPTNPPTTPMPPDVVQPAAHGPADSFLPGYYYYFYPIKSFLKNSQTPAPAPTTTTTTAKPVQMHATVTMMDTSNKSVEPLFMAISGFIGMALMFAFSVLFVPKFGKLRSGEMDANKGSHDLLSLARVVFDSMEGKDCAERLACEIGRFIRVVKLDDKALRVLEIVLPPKLGDQITLVRKSASKKEKCSSIPCKLKKPSRDKEKRKPTPKPSTPHELWMQRFGNRTRFPQPENIWHRNPSTSPES